MADNVIDLTSDSECDSDYAFKSATNVASAPSTHKETTASPTASPSASRQSKADTEREGVTLTVNQLLEGLGLQFADHSDPNLEADEREVIEELLDILSQYNKGDVRKELEGMSSGCSDAETLLEAHPGSKFVFYRSITIYK
jgi:hypothetical protein